MTLDEQNYLHQSAEKYNKRTAFNSSSNPYGTADTLQRKMNKSSSSLERSITRLAAAQREGRAPIYTKVTTKFSGNQVKRAQTAKRRQAPSNMMDTIQG